MATGIIGTLGPSASLIYSSSVDAKVTINAAALSASGTTSVNGQVMLSLANISAQSATFHIGAGQQMQIANNAAMSCVVSILEAT